MKGETRTRPGMARVPLLVASQVLLIDQVIQTVARRAVTVLDEKPLTDWLGLVWQTPDPGHAPSTAVLTAWMLLTLLVVAGLGLMIRRSGDGFAPRQAMAVGLLLGGTLAHGLDLWRWGEVVATLHVHGPGLSTLTGAATLAQWLGLLLLVLHGVRGSRRRA